MRNTGGEELRGLAARAAVSTMLEPSQISPASSLSSSSASSSEAAGATRSASPLCCVIGGVAASSKRGAAMAATTMDERNLLLVGAHVKLAAYAGHSEEVVDVLCYDAPTSTFFCRYLADDRQMWEESAEVRRGIVVKDAAPPLPPTPRSLDVDAVLGGVESEAAPPAAAAATRPALSTRREEGRVAIANALVWHWAGVAALRLRDDAAAAATAASAAGADGEEEDEAVELEEENCDATEEYATSRSIEAHVFAGVDTWRSIHSAQQAAAIVTGDAGSVVYDRLTRTAVEAIQRADAEGRLFALHRDARPIARDATCDRPRPPRRAPASSDASAGGVRAAAAHETMRSGDTVDFSPIGGSFTRAPPASQPWTMHVLRPLPSLFVANPDQRRASLLPSTIAIAASRAGASTCAADARIVPKQRRSAAELDAREAAVHAAAVASVAQSPPPSREYREWVDDDDTVVAKKRKWSGCASERAGKIKRSRFSDVGCKLVDLIECGMVQEGCTISFLYEKQTFQSKLLKKGKVKWQKQIYNLLGKWVLDCKRTLNPKIKKTDLPSTLAATIVGRSTPVRLAELKERYLIEQGAMEYSGGDAGAAGGGSGGGVGSRSGYGATDGGANDEHQRNYQHGDPSEEDFEVESNPMVRAVIRAKLASNDTALPVTVGSCLDALTTVLRQSTTHDVRCKMSFLCHFSFLFAFAYH